MAQSSDKIYNSFELRTECYPRPGSLPFFPEKNWLIGAEADQRFIFSLFLSGLSSKSFFCFRGLLSDYGFPRREAMNEKRYQNIGHPLKAHFVGGGEK
jgi:hypothetical protein